MIRTHPVPSHRRGGFSLVELLVAVSITSLILVLLSSILSVALNQWNRQTGRMRNNIEAQVALDMLVDDLRSVTIKEGRAEWFHLRTRETPDLGQTVELFLLSRPIDNRAEVGDTAAIAYRIEKRPPFPGADPIHGLYRTVLPPAETIEHLGSENLHDDIWKTDGTPTTDDLVCNHVVGFELDVIFRLPSGKFFRLDSADSLRLSKYAFLESEDRSRVPPGATIYGFDMRLTVVDQFAQNLLHQGTVPLEDLISRHGYTYTSTVDFASRAL